MPRVTERRKTKSQAAIIEHAVGLMRTHGTSYASRYLRNQKFTSETIARVLSDNGSDRRIVPSRSEHRTGSSEGEGARQEGTTRQLSYKSRKLGRQR